MLWINSSFVQYSANLSTDFCVKFHRKVSGIKGNLVMTKNGGDKRQTKGQRREELERKRDDRVRRNALKKERKAKEYQKEDDNFVSFSKQLEALGLKIKDIPGDGNCLFRSLGDQIDGVHVTHARHRRETVKYMRDHRDDFEPFMEDNISFDQHLHDLSKLSTYGGNDSIVAFARNHGVNIVIHQLNEPRWVIYGADYCRNGQVHELHISYHNGEHYSSVRYISDDSTEPAWIQHNQAMSAVVAMPTKTEPSGNRKERKSKEKEKRTEITAANNTDKSMNYAQGNDPTAEELVMTATGCKDLTVVAHTLEDNAYDVDASINYILQMMYVAEETGCLSEDLFATSTEPSNEQLQTAGCTCNVVEPEQSIECTVSVAKETSITNESCINCSTANSARTTEDKETCSNPPCGQSEDIQGFMENLRETLSQSDQKANKSYVHQGARPKVADKSKNRQESSNAHLSNKKRKELAKQEKKKRREDRRKEDNASLCLVNGEQHTAAASSLAPDLGLLTI